MLQKQLVFLGKKFQLKYRNCNNYQIINVSNEIEIFHQNIINHFSCD